jgi:hypothetical protein
MLERAAAAEPVTPNAMRVIEHEPCVVALASPRSAGTGAMSPSMLKTASVADAHRASGSPGERQAHRDRNADGA